MIRTPRVSLLRGAGAALVVAACAGCVPLSEAPRSPWMDGWSLRAPPPETAPPPSDEIPPWSVEPVMIPALNGTYGGERLRATGRAIFGIYRTATLSFTLRAKGEATGAVLRLVVGGELLFSIRSEALRVGAEPALVSIFVPARLASEVVTLEMQVDPAPPGVVFVVGDASITLGELNPIEVRPRR